MATAKRTVRDGDPDEMLGPRQVARLLGKGLTWVYANFQAMGGIKLGNEWRITRRKLREAQEHGV